MANISEESRLIIASNLTVATVLRDLLNYQRGETPIKESDTYIVDKFEGIVEMLSTEK